MSELLAVRRPLQRVEQVDRHWEGSGTSEQAQDIVREGDSAYVMQGTVDVGRLQDLFDVRLEEHDTATVGGLVSAIAGRIPQPGEVIEEDGLRFEVLESTDRKIEKLRVTRSLPSSPAKKVLA